MADKKSPEMMEQRIIDCRAFVNFGICALKRLNFNLNEIEILNSKNYQATSANIGKFVPLKYGGHKTSRGGPGAKKIRNRK